MWTFLMILPYLLNNLFCVVDGLGAVGLVPAAGVGDDASSVLLAIATVGDGELTDGGGVVVNSF